MPQPFSLYLHIPFCRHRCAYCDFNTYAGLDHLRAAYVQALVAEVRWAGEAAGRRLPVHSVYFGGGTPSLLTPEQIEQVLLAVEAVFALADDAEITLEANPGTVDEPYLRTLRRLGVNRLSLGVQSAHPEELRLLERIHDYPTVTRTVAAARRAGFDNLNLDLIFGLPGQPLSRWQRTLDLVLALHPEHLSLYALTLEHGTPMAAWVARGLLPAPDEDVVATMYEWAMDRLEAAGYVQYEISNWARPGYLCRHNLQYWRNLPYLGLGAGAHGWAAGVRTVNVRAPAAYIQRLRAGEVTGPFPRTPATVEARPVGRREEMGETMMMGLRLTQEGVSRQAFVARFGQPLEAVYGEEIAELVRLGLLMWTADGARLRLTRRGRLLGNVVFAAFV